MHLNFLSSNVSMPQCVGETPGGMIYSHKSRPTTYANGFLCFVLGGYEWILMLNIYYWLFDSVVLRVMEQLYEGPIVDDVIVKDKGQPGQ